jgi:hypothetical protein
LAELHAEIEKIRLRLRSGHVPSAFRDILKPLAEAVALARELGLDEEVARFESVREEAREVARTELAAVAALAEKAVSRMYERAGGAGAYSEAKDLFVDAIGLAERLGSGGEAKRLEARLAEVKAVFRDQLG